MSLHTLFETQVKIGISDADFQKGIAAAGTAVKDFAAMGTQAIANFTKSLVSGVSELAQYGDHIDKQSQKMNMSAQAYQEWDAVLQHSGASIDSMQTSMKTLANAADSDNEAFTRLGMSLDDVKKMSSEELFSATITALQNVENETERTAIASDLLGRGAMELGALLNTSAEDTEKMRQRVHELGGVMSDEAVKASAAFQDSLQDMKTSIGGLTRGLKSEFLPSFTDVMDGLTKIFAGEEGGEQLVNKGIANIMTTLSKSAEKLKPVITQLGDIAFKLIQDNMPRIVVRGTRIVGTIAKEIISNLPEILSNAKDVLSDVGSEIGSMLLEFLPDFMGEDVKNVFGSIGDFVRNIDLSKLKDAFSGLGESLEPLAEKLSGGVSWAFENVLKPLGTWLANDALPAAIDVLSGAFDALDSALDVLAPIGEAVWSNFLSPLFSAVGDLAVGSLDMLASSLKTIAEAFKGFDTSGFLDDVADGNFFEDWKIGMKAIGEGLDGFGGKIDEFFSANGVAEKWNKFWQNVGGLVYEAKETIVHAIEDIIGVIDKVEQKIEGHWDFWEGFGEYLFDKWHEPLEGYATGGYVTTPRTIRVAEKEPEYVIPESKMDSVYKRNGGNTIYLTVNIEGGIASDYDAYRAAEQMSQALGELAVWENRAIGGTGT